MATSIIPKPMSGASSAKFDSSSDTIAYKVGSVVNVTCSDFTWYSSAQGVIHKGSLAGSAWTLPEGYRPPHIVEFADARYGKRMRVMPNGEIVSIDALNGDGLRFSVCFISDPRFT